ncbi:hypothetical protein BJX68DRAFT_267468 [Aspergillus pseudodeflectus]|uniref:Zn(2)-C6 fungal-type domain-containing protein n=1 Tax=Aspergillus pseudodeflectus TaxID=176178 RepID=A0ABR4K8I1_9EURO
MKSCIPCSKRHLKCDRRHPTCLRCEKSRSKTACTYFGARFRPSRLSIAAASERTASEITDSSPGPQSEPEPRAETCSSPHGGSQRESAASQDPSIPRENGDLPQSASPLTASHNDQIPSLPSATPPDSRPLLNLAGHDSHGPLLIEYSPSDFLSLAYTEEHGPRLESQKLHVSQGEADFFQCYLEHAGVWLDVVSPARLFSQTVPQLALHNPVLYYSCLAYAAHVQYLWGRADRAKADYYHNEAIGLLIPLLDAKTQPQASTEDLLATIVILRMSEQFSEPGEDAQCHLYGAFSLLTSSRAKWPPDRVDLKGTAFWTFVRQSLRICFLFEQGCPFDLGIVDCSNLFAPAKDEVWTNRMTYLLARTCNLCWSSGYDADSRVAQLEALEVDINSWREALPDAFKAWYYRQTRSETFPTIRYLSRWHVVAWQQYYTAKTMLAIYQHKTQLVDSYRDISIHLNSTILTPARLTCGVVLSDTDVGSCINGAHLAYWCGQFFTGREEQIKLLEWLEGFMQKTKWPNKTCIMRLQKLWGISDGQSTTSPPVV